MFRLACGPGCALTGVLRGITSIDGGTRDVTVRVERSTATVTSVINRKKVFVASPRGRHGIVEDYICIVELAGPVPIEPRIFVLARDFEAILKIIGTGVATGVRLAPPLVCRGGTVTRFASARVAVVQNVARSGRSDVFLVLPRIKDLDPHIVVCFLIGIGLDPKIKTFRSFR